MDYLISIFALLGGAFVLLAVIGVWRLPDALSKMHAATKAGAFATGWLLLAAVLHHGSLRAFVMGALFLAFYYITAPLGAMFLARGLLSDADGECKDTPPS